MSKFKLSEQTFAAAAAGKNRDTLHWRDLRDKASQNWLGEHRSPSESSSLLRDGTGLFAWNVGKQLCTSRHEGNDLTERAAWFELLDTASGLGVDIAALSEMGSGGTLSDETRVRAILAQWSRLRGREAQHLDGRIGQSC